MKITAYPLHDRAATLAPAPEGRGWNFLCPAAFEAVWNGGPGAEDVEIRYDEASLGPAGFVQSQQGGGRLTFHPGYQCQTERDIALWVRGPAQAPKDGLHPLESTLDTSVLPGTVLIDWQFLRPGQTVRFAAGEPFCTILPYPKAGENGVTVDVMPRAGDGVLAAYEAALERLAESQAGVATPPRRGRWATQLTAAHQPPVPPVSCLCPTRGRVELLEEAIHSFLEQDYPGPKELIVVNDVAGQTLVYDHPEVQIVNLPCRFHSLAEAYKAAAGLAAYDLLFLWPDDAISLPHRLSFSVAHFGGREALFKADKTWLWNAGELSGPEPEAPHGGGCWRRDGFVRRRGYPHAEEEYESALEAQCEAEEPGAVRVHPTATDDIYFIRRVETPEIQAMPEIPEGPIRLRPRWRTDYQALVAARLPLPRSPEDQGWHSAKMIEEEWSFGHAEHEAIVDIVLCVWGRIDSLPWSLSCLEFQREKRFRLLIWNNNVERRRAVEEKVGEFKPKFPVRIFHSDKNYGSFGRFLLIKANGVRMDQPVITIDDDQALCPEFVSALLERFDPDRLVGSWAWRFKPGGSYWDRERCQEGAEAHYIGAGGLIFDPKICAIDAFHGEIPERFYLVDDVWMSFYASRVLGHKLIAAPELWREVRDGKNQYPALYNTKIEFLNWLRSEKGWQV